MGVVYQLCSCKVRKTGGPVPTTLVQVRRNAILGGKYVQALQLFVAADGFEPPAFGLLSRLIIGNYLTETTMYEYPRSKPWEPLGVDWS